METQITLSKSQAEAEAAFSRFLQNRTAKVFRLSGSAGTGKTFEIGRMLNQLPVGRVIGLSPTHRACQNMREYINGKCEVKTLDSYFGLVPKKIDGEIVMKQRANYDVGAYADIDYVIVDEKGMVASYGARFIADDIRSNRRRYILVGDPCQLRPVKETLSELDRWDVPEDYDRSLWETHRFGSAIIEEATKIRNVLTGREKSFVLADNIQDGSGVSLLPEREWGAIVKDMIKDPEFATNPRFFKLLAYDNISVLDYEARVDRQLGLTRERPFRVGERVVANEAYSRDDELILGTCEELEIVSIDPHFNPSHNLPAWDLGLVRSNGELVECFALTPDGAVRADFLALLEERRKKALQTKQWSDFYRLQEYYADIRKGTALTVHKMQGSSADYVAVDMASIYAGEGKKGFDYDMADRLLYTAITRARKGVFIKK